MNAGAPGRCVVVGAGAVGTLFARLLTRSGADVLVVDRAPVGRESSALPRFLRGDVTGIGAELARELGAADTVFLAVPEQVALSAVRPLAGLLRPGTLLVDTLSVKTPLIKLVREVAGALEVVGLNPMFAPSLGIEGRPVATVVVNEGPRGSALLRLIEDWGGRVVQVDEHDHDRLAAASQALTHAAVLGFGLALSHLDVNIDELSAIAPPPAAMLLALLARITAGSPEVYWDVQAANPQAPAAREALAQGLRRIADHIADVADFATLLDECRGFLGSHDEHYAAACAHAFTEMNTPRSAASSFTSHHPTGDGRGTMPLAEKESNPANWVESRISKTSDSMDRAFSEGLTGHVVTERSGKRVRLQDGSESVEFVSCSYLGLEEHPALVDAATEALKRYGAHLSSSRNRMRPVYLGELEELLSTVYQGNKAVAFTSVGNVHLGLLPLLGSGALPSYPVSPRGVTFIVDRTAHASMQVIRGILEQIGPLHRFDLADQEALARILGDCGAAGRTPIVLVDGVGSMGGLIDVVGLRAALEPYGGHLYVDDAHGISITGPLGGGYAFEEFGDQLPPNVVVAGSLSKGFGGAGGFALVPADADVRVLRKFANPLVFGHSIMLPMLAADVAAARLHLSGEVAALQQRLWRNADELDALTGGQLVNAGLRSPVRGAHYPTEEEGFAAARRLRAAGVLVLPAFFPTVAKGTGLVRLALSALHEREHLETAAKALALAPAGD
ncbi:aminotransferase class I/II-fold pyridoxal phosphate-dependent enzyme [Streptomyces sp. ASQP_92]|uniref:aminotransferase class I/II-fold pyridoxal phosphate-dependent enzyme n=1 Tax=Streptomyces sp. ASQP_92 TaxID=2979116 RepID=UPI0021C03620|nr:aminotransferase class I/II-fold pyridoxal phosphate-dependent enzyme [Streptomyces sp. ASQP_92]MCT9089836.1 aminotransferase class I/II-fold pyridoxal phosphate-dependent enzyme [Streptomyces sp. ASQP_92]